MSVFWSESNMHLDATISLFLTNRFYFSISTLYSIHLHHLDGRVAAQRDLFLCAAIERSPRRFLIGRAKMPSFQCYCDSFIYPKQCKIHSLILSRHIESTKHSEARSESCEQKQRNVCGISPRLIMMTTY